MEVLCGNRRSFAERGGALLNNQFLSFVRSSFSPTLNGCHSSVEDSINMDRELNQLSRDVYIKGTTTILCDLKLRVDFTQYFPFKTVVTFIKKYFSIYLLNLS